MTKGMIERAYMRTVVAFFVFGATLPNIGLGLNLAVAAWVTLLYITHSVNTIRE